MVKVEACISGDSALQAGASAAAAFRGGADTIELCASMQLDGLSPSEASIAAARAAFSRPGLMVMARPRGGDFCYSDSEVEEIESQIRRAAETGADGVVFGLLTRDGRIDEPRVKRMVGLSRYLGLKTTFHRAFDAIDCREEAMDQLLAMGIDRILTSGVAWGQPGSALDGTVVLDECIQRCAEKAEIVIGGGVSPEGAPSILKALRPWKGALSVHAYSGVMTEGKTSEFRVRALVEAVSEK